MYLWWRCWCHSLLGTAPVYLSDYCTSAVEVASRQLVLCSVIHHELTVPQHWLSKYGHQVFSVAGLMTRLAVWPFSHHGNLHMTPGHISSQTINMSLAPVDDFCYLGSMMSSPLEDLKHRRGMAWGTLWKLETLIVSCYHIYGAESWPIDAQMTRLISSFGTSAYHIMTGVKRLDKVCNTTVLVTVSRNELIHTAYDHQLRFLGHMQKPMRYTSQLTAVQDTVVLEQSTLITSRN